MAARDSKTALKSFLGDCVSFILDRLKTNKSGL